jgi:YidC/Oxa1 family membrane protein insertase
MNFFYSIIPNYGVAIILLTIIVRLIFWPLTRKSTLAMRKMTEVQPLIKKVQEKFKGNPQKIQQETFMIYRKHQVNPLASCFPMLIQIPIFIAFFAMLRSVAELRFEGFLWISDLSQPENLFAGTLPIAINILPILTSVTMAIQTHLSPSSGDPAQKKMMTWMMPIMMLFFFYNMSSALCLYWTVSQLLSIAQMLWMRRTTPATTKA